MAADRPAMGAAASLSSFVMTPLGVPSSVVLLCVLVVLVLRVVRNGKTGAVSDFSLTRSVVVAREVVVDVVFVVVVVVVIDCLASVTGLTKSFKSI